MYKDITDEEMTFFLDQNEIVKDKKSINQKDFVEMFK
jgi:hypothetical protein